MSLSARRAKFVNEYMLDHNGSRAARAAGYAESGARVTAHRLLTNANVKAAIALKTQDLAKQYELSKQKVINEIRAAIELAKFDRDANTMIRGWSEIAKLLQFYDPEVFRPKTLDENKALKAKLEAMSDDELMAISSQK